MTEEVQPITTVWLGMDPAARPELLGGSWGWAGLWLFMYLLNCRATLHASTNVSPVSLLFQHPFTIGFLPFMSKSSPRDFLVAAESKAKPQQSLLSNIARLAQPHMLALGDFVLL